jgi:hypothetical protein
MGFFGAYSAYQVGDKKSVWDLRDYGFSGLWVKRASTVVVLSCSAAVTVTCDLRKSILGIGCVAS